MHKILFLVRTLFLIQYFTTLLSSLFGFPIHMLYNTFSKVLYSNLRTVSYVLSGYLLVDFQPLTALIFSVYFCVAAQFNDKLISFLPLYLQDVFPFLLLSNSYLFPHFLSQFYLYSTALYIMFLSPAIFHFKVTQLRFHTVQEVAKRSCSPSTDEQSGGMHKEAVHIAAIALCLEPNKSIKLQSNAQMCCFFRPLLMSVALLQLHLSTYTLSP